VQDKAVALVTGANQGIGLQIAKELATALASCGTPAMPSRKLFPAFAPNMILGNRNYPDGLLGLGDLEVKVHWVRIRRSAYRYRYTVRAAYDSELG
jgi:hypothetical protein